MSLARAHERFGAPVLIGVTGTTTMLGLFSRFEPGWVAIGWVCLLPWLWALEQARSRREAVFMGAALAVAYTATIFGWFPESLQSYSRAPLAVCWLVFLALAPLMQAQFLAFAWVRHHLRHGPASPGASWRVPLTCALVYVGTEWLSPKLFADTLGQGFIASESLRQAADLAGAHGLTLVLLLGNECVFALGRALMTRGARPGPRAVGVPLVGLVALVLGTAGYGQSRLRQVAGAAAREPGLSVGIVQANITKYDKLAAEVGMYDVVRMILDTHYALSEALLRERPVDLLIWPETVYPTTFGTPKSEAGAEFDADLSGFVSRSRVPLLFGTYDLEGAREYNAALFLGPGRDGTLARSAYRKTMLFPLTEWVPESLDSPRLRELLPWTGYWKRGPGPRTLAVTLRDGRPLTLAPLICYESIFPGYVAEEARQGAELIVTLSNDSWFMGTPGPRQHLMQAAFRSIETRLPQVRVTNSGISALLDATGAVLAEVPDDTRASRVLTIPPAPGLSTLMVRWGDWLRPTALVLAVLLLLGSQLQRRAPPPA